MIREPLTAVRAAHLIAANTEEVKSPELGQDPVMSVCLITYNHAKFIRESLDSVYMQGTSFPMEVVIGDDHSTDGTTEIVLEYQRRYPERTRVLLAKENLGHYSGNGRLNFVRTLGACRGKYVAMLEGDDYWTDPHKLSKQVALLERRRGSAGAFHETALIDYPRGRVLGSEPLHNKDAIDIDDIVSPVLCFHTSSAVIRRDALGEPFPDWFFHTASGDLPLFAFASLHGPFLRVPGCMSVWRRHPGGVTFATPDHQGVHGHLARIHLWLCLRQHLPEAQRAAIDSTCVHHCQEIARETDVVLGSRGWWVARRVHWLLQRIFSRGGGTHRSKRLARAPGDGAELPLGDTLDNFPA